MPRCTSQYRGEMKGWLLNVQLYLESFGALFTKSIYWTAYLNSLRIGDPDTDLPAGRIPDRLRHRAGALDHAHDPADDGHPAVLDLVLLRVYAWIGLLKNNGVINNFLMWTGIIDQPIVMLQTDFAIYVGIVYSYLPS